MSSATSITPVNEQALKQDASRGAFRIGLLAAPALILIVLLIILPVGWILGLSFVEKGQFSFAHYERLVAYSAYSTVLITTLRVSLITTAICVFAGYPVAYLIAQLPHRLAMIMISLVIIPFWTSLLVRTYAWLVLLTDKGPINQSLMSAGLIDGPLPLLFNEVGTIIGMVHIMLPFFVLPVYGVVRSFDWTLIQAASSLGASPTSGFFRVFLPISIPGVFTGAVLVFVQCLGFYVTPAVLGGGKVNMVSMKIASNIQQYFDWGAASALGMVLLICALAVLYVAQRLFDLDRMLGAR